MARRQVVCEVVRVDTEQTKCQHIGATYWMGLARPPSLCPRAFAACYGAAKDLLERPPADGDSAVVEVECPEGFVTFRLKRRIRDLAAAAGRRRAVPRSGGTRGLPGEGGVDGRTPPASGSPLRGCPHRGRG